MPVGPQDRICVLRKRRCGFMEGPHESKVAKGVRYRHLPALVPRLIRLESFDTIADSVTDFLSRNVPWTVHFQGPESKYIGFAVAKYGILDLT